MQITVNGEVREEAGPLTLSELLLRLDLAGKRVAVECDGQIIPRSLHASTTLLPGAQLEIVVAVGGG